MIKLKYINLYLCLYHLKMIASIVLIAVLILVVVTAPGLVVLRIPGLFQSKSVNVSNKVVIQYSKLIHKGASTAFCRVA